MKKKNKNNWINLNKNAFLPERLREKYKKQRIKKGYSEYDVWDMSNYLLEILPNMLRYLAENCNSIPDNFKNITQWQTWLETAAIHFDLAKEGAEHNQYQKEFEKTVDKWRVIGENEHGWTTSYIAKEGKDEVDAITKKYLDKQREIHENQKAHLHQGLKMLEEHFFDLWD